MTNKEIIQNVRDMGYVVQLRKRTAIKEPFESAITGKYIFKDIATSSKPNDTQFLYQFLRDNKLV